MSSNSRSPRRADTFVTVPELPGCLSEGDTSEQAWEMIQDAMQGWLEVAARHGDHVPSKFQRLLGSGS